MKTKLYQIGIAVLMLLTFGQANGQVLNDFKGIQEHYKHLKTYQMNFDVKVIGQKAKVLQTQNGVVIHTEGLHYVDYGGNKTLILGKEFVTVNENYKLMVYNTGERFNEQNQVGTDLSASLDSLFAKNTTLKFSYIGGGSQEKTIFIEEKDHAVYDAYAITFDLKTFRLLKYVYYLKVSEDQVVREIQITYTNESTKPKTSLSYLRMNYYLNKAYGSLKPTERFTGYKLIDQRSK